MNKDVKYLTPKRSVKEIHGTERRAASAQAVAELMFVKAAQEQQLLSLIHISEPTRPY